MPYNNTPIPPMQEVTGSCSLPLARIKKIIRADIDTGECSNNAAFAIAVATESFVQYIVEQTHTVVKSERKPRRNIQYRDVAGAVSKYDNLDFLSDVVPHTIPFKELKIRPLRQYGALPERMLLENQQTIAFGKSPIIGDQEMSEAEVADSEVVNGGSPVQTTTGASARHTFDAVRSSIDPGPAPNIPIEED